MIKVYPLGTGGAFTKHYHNNYIFELGDRKLLVDAGTTLRFSLPAAGYKETDVTDIMITHLHADHVGGLEEFAQRCMWLYSYKPNLWIRAELAEGIEDVLKAGLFTDGLQLSDYFHVHYEKDGFQLGNDYEIEFIKTDNLHAKDMLSMGFKLSDKNDNVNIIYTSDIGKHEEALFDKHFDENTKALFHDISFIQTPVHSYIDDVIAYYSDKLALPSLYGMHYADDIDAVEIEKKYGIQMVKIQQPLVFP
ncbi:MBL fold metallo-hydrolase [Niallia sp. BSM11]|uniref:MBL fold metallo-hydrolase n=1 Tax=Niallia sp. BSM11 TaxID=3391576 RepID=UPI003984E397